MKLPDALDRKGEIKQMAGELTMKFSISVPNIY